MQNRKTVRTDLTTATYKNRFNYSFDFDSMMIEKGWSE